jgi:hypothetical protein
MNMKISQDSPLYQTVEELTEQYEQSEAEHMAETAELVDMIYTSDMEAIG